MTDSFWTGGPDAYESGLRAQYDALLRDLRSRLAECSDGPQRSECEIDIAQTEAEYKSKLNGIGKLFF